jgi:hypothetical protein
MTFVVLTMANIMTGFLNVMGAMECHRWLPMYVYDIFVTKIYFVYVISL